MAFQSHRISVVGTGYLGATHAICMASLGHDVVAVDVDEAKIAALRSGRVPFFEPGLDELLADMLASGRLRFTTDPAQAGRQDAHFICVGTPQAKGSDAADLTYVLAAVDALTPHLRDGALVIGKSTVPMGTADALAQRIASATPAADVDLAWNPEFLREGFAVADSLRPDRLVLGVGSARAEGILRSLYAPITDTDEVPVIVTDLATAEVVKVAANSFLATKISFINAMAEICDRIGADVTTLAQALAHDSRIGARFLRPGLGFGGGCLPKDIRAFQHRAGELGVAEAVQFLREIDQINIRCRIRTVDAVAAMVGDLRGARVAALGAAFKPDSDDIRDAPALAVAAALADAGAQVTIFDPAAMDNARRHRPDLRYAPTTLAAITDADVVVLLTEWNEFKQLDPVIASRYARGRAMVDARHALDADRWRAAGWRYAAPGRPVLEPTGTTADIESSVDAALAELAS